MTPKSLIGHRLRAAALLAVGSEPARQGLARLVDLIVA
jgi:hypothetical protein